MPSNEDWAELLHPKTAAYTVCDAIVHWQTLTAMSLTAAQRRGLVVTFQATLQRIRELDRLALTRTRKELWRFAEMRRTGYLLPVDIRLLRHSLGITLEERVIR